MITINNQSLEDFLDKSKGVEIIQEMRREVGRSTIDNSTRTSSYLTSRRAANRPLFDKSQKHGKVKIYSAEEIKQMNILNFVTKNEKLMFHIIDEAPRPLTTNEAKSIFIQKYPDILSPRSSASFDSIFNGLVKDGLVTKLTMKDGKYYPWEKNKFAHYVTTEKAKRWEQNKDTAPPTSCPEQTDQPAQNQTQTQNQNQDPHIYLAEWMEANGIAEFSISIRRKE